MKFYREFSAVLSDPSITAVALATPAVTHYEMAKAALEAGKDVFVEKPLAIDVKHGEDLVQLADAKRQNPDGRPHPPLSPRDPEIAGTDSRRNAWTRSTTCTPTA